MKNSIYKLAVAIGYMLLYSEHAISACIKNPSFSGENKSLPGKVINIQYDDMEVKTLATLVTSTFVSQPTSLAQQPSNIYCGAQMQAAYLSPWTSRLSGKMVSTNISGISLDISVTYSPGMLPGKSTITPTSYILQPNDRWTVNILKRGQIKSGGYIDGGQIAEYFQLNTVINNRFNISRLSIPTNGIRINVLSCSLKNTVPTINLGDWYDTQFPTIGSTSNEVDIPITLSCLAGTNIKATINATSGIVNAAQGQLALSGSDTATGVAIQILDQNKTPVPLGSKITVRNNTTAGDYIFGWKARYIKTENQITPGTANATATVNIRYE